MSLNSIQTTFGDVLIIVLNCYSPQRSPIKIDSEIIFIYDFMDDTVQADEEGKLE